MGLTIAVGVVYVMGRALGLNPSRTIASLAERNIDLLLCAEGSTGTGIGTPSQF